MDVYECSTLELTASGTGVVKPRLPLIFDSNRRSVLRIDDLSVPVSTGGAFNDFTAVQYAGRKSRIIDGHPRMTFVRVHEWQYGEIQADSQRSHPEQLLLVHMATTINGFLRITSTEFTKTRCQTPVDPTGRRKQCATCGQSYRYDRDGNPSHPLDGAIPVFSGKLPLGVAKMEELVRPRAMVLTIRPDIPQSSRFAVRMVAVPNPSSDVLTHRGYPTWIIEFTRIPSFAVRVIKVEDLLQRPR